MKKQYLLKLDEQLLAALKELAASENRSLNNYLAVKLTDLVATQRNRKQWISDIVLTDPAKR